MEEKDYVVIYRVGTKCNYIYKGVIKYINRENLDLLKKTLSIPFIIEFKGLSRSQLGRVLSEFRNDGIMMYRTVKPNYDGLAIEFLEKKRIKKAKKKIKTYY